MRKRFLLINMVLVILLSFSGCGRPLVDPNRYSGAGDPQFACVDGKIFVDYVPNIEKKEYEWPEDGVEAGRITKFVDVTKPFRWEDGSWMMYQIEGRGFPYIYVEEDVILVLFTSIGYQGCQVMYYYCDVNDFSWSGPQS